MASLPKPGVSSGKLGAFGGVFAPSILTILGIIFFLRTGYVVGEVGLGDAIVIITICYAISLLTSLSLSAIATSMKVKGGGFYYVISRTLGFEFGGALGSVLFLSISTGIAFYAIGLGEVVVGLPGLPGWVTPRIVATAAIVLFFALAWAGADVATQLQYVVMAIVLASIVAIAWGGVAAFDADRAAANGGTLFASEGGALGFWAAFALFFPAITGFTQGLNMSGDLGRPTRDIPLGTLAAVGLSYLLYVGLAVLVAGYASAETLRGDYLILNEIAPYGWIVTAGVIAATASSALASFLGAPRIAQAVGRDGVFPASRLLAVGTGPSDNPRRAVALSGAIALGAVMIGDLNFLAPIITMFFLASYGLLNYATYYVAEAASPSFRPSFRLFHKYLSLAGALLCVATMLAIDIVSAVVAVVAIFAIHQYLQGRVERKMWADSQSAYGFQQVRETLFQVAERPAHPQDWRPQILIFSKKEDYRRELLRFAEWIEAGSGLTSLVSMIETERGDTRGRETVREELDRSISDTGVEAFPLVVSAPDFRTGFGLLLQSYGVGPLRANTILLNWNEQLPPNRSERSRRAYGRNLGVALDEGYNTIVLNARPEAVAAIHAAPDEARRIDIWWCGRKTSELSLLLAYLMTRMSAWQQATIRILAQARADRPERTHERIASMLDDVHIEATVELTDDLDEATIERRSGDAALVFFPGTLSGRTLEAHFGLDLTRIVESLSVVAVCVAGEDIDLAPDPDDAENG